MSQPVRPADPAWSPAAAARAVARSDSLDATLEALLRDAVSAVEADSAAVFLWASEGGVLQLAACQGVPEPARPPLEAEVAGNPEHPTHAAARGAGATMGPRPALPGGATTTGADLPLVVSRHGIDEPLGVVSFGWAGERSIDDNARVVLETTADLAALTVDRARLESLSEERGDWMARVATADPLTGLASRRTLDRILELEIERAKRMLGDVSVAVFDIDGFRALNEREGTAAGDLVLRSVAAVLAEQVRLVDTVARIGGDEFAIVAPGSGGVVVADRILRAIDTLDAAGMGPVSVSAGIARFPADGTSAEELLDAALGALEAARTSGQGAIAEVRAG